MAGNLFWVLAYDTEYAMVDRDDDLKIGIKTSAITLGQRDVAAIMVFYLLYLTVWGLAMATVAPFVVTCFTLAAAVAQVTWHYTLIRARDRNACFRAFCANH